MPIESIFPGDSLEEYYSDRKNIIGPGIYKDPQTQEILPASAGILCTNELANGRLIYIDSNSKRYVPHANDYVIGIVVGVIGESYKVQLQNFSSLVLLSMMAFPNATKKNRPNLKNGQAIYARVSQAIPEVETEIECIDPVTGKEGGFGPLDESGYIFDVNLNFSRGLLYNKENIFLEKLATKCKFEIAIGINGKIWLKCGDGLKQNHESDDYGAIKDLKSTLAAFRFLQACQSITADEADKLLKQCFRIVD